MKVLMINSVCGIGSTGKICTDLASELEGKGHTVKIAYGRGIVPKKYEKYAVRIGNDFDVYEHGIRARIFDCDGFGSKDATKNFIKWVMYYDPDVIHLHNLHGYYINIELLFEYIKNFRKKVIWTLHDCWAFTGHCAHFAFNGCYKWIDGQCVDCQFKNVYPKSILFSNSNLNFLKKEFLFCGVADLTIVTPSKWLANLVEKSFLKNYSIKVINNGIDINIFQPTLTDFKERYDLNNKVVLLGVAFDWGVRKGLDLFVSLAQKLPENYQIILVGTNSNVEKQLPSNIIAVKKTNSQKELAEIYSIADVFLNLTREDNYPTVNMESIACGTPVITFNTGGSIESIDNDTGWIVEQGDIGAIINILQCDLHRKSYFQDCVNKRLLFDKSIMCIKYMELYLT